MVKTGICVAVVNLLIVTATLANDDVAEIVVTGTRAPTDALAHIGNIDRLQRDTIENTAATHIHELLSRVAGVWVARGSGQESLPSIRSPVLTGAGSCGAFLTLEDGIPSRPNGFCNVNQLFELPTEFAQGVEVIRGPGNALYGSNALHGTVNVLLPDTGDGDALDAGLEFGPNSFTRIDGLLRVNSNSPTVFGIVAADDGGFREDSGYRQVKAFAKKDWSVADTSVTANLSLSDLEQETAGFIFGEDAYKDALLNRQNLNPEAYRDASSQRFSLQILRPGERLDLDIRPFLRHSDMAFLQHYLPGQPVEENGQVSIGVLAQARIDSENRMLLVGFDVEASDVYLRETQYGETEGSDFLRETRPEGKHYDYDVSGVTVAAYVQTEHRASGKLTLSAGLRGEYTHYDYSNNMLTGNTRDDGSECGFGGCLYTRPASRTDSFADVVPKLGALLELSEVNTLFVNASRGFRAPQMTELYRLQNGQQVSDLDAESVDSIELGLRSRLEAWHLDVSAFAMRKKNSVLRDAEGFNVSGGRSRHIGIEAQGSARLGGSWVLQANGTYARHRYDFNLVAARGETFVSGNDVDTAPRWQGSAELRYEGPGRFDAGLQWVSLGSYYLDAENSHEYAGHDLINLRARVRLSDKLEITARVNNLADRDYADRADFAFGNYRYFPGRGREVFLQLRYTG